MDTLFSIFSDHPALLILTHVGAFFVGGFCAWLSLCVAAYGED